MQKPLSTGTNKYILDIETDGLDATKIYCVVIQKVSEFSGVQEVSFGIPEVFTYGGAFGYPSLNDFRKRFLGIHDTIFVGHNIISFDIPIINRLLRMDIQIEHQAEDTLLMSQIADPRREGGNSLKNWGKILNFPKQEFTDFAGGLTEKMIEYCVQDVSVNAKVWMTLRNNKDIPENVLQMERHVRHIIDKQKDYGFCLDMPEAMIFYAFLEDSLNIVEKELQDIFEPTTIQMKTKTKIIPFNPGSRQQIGDRLINKFGWEPKEFTPTGQPKIDETILKAIGSTEALKMVDYLTLQKRKAHVQSWIAAADEDNMVHGSVRTLGTVTGRMTHNNPNMAQVPSVRAVYGDRCRSLWVPKDRVNNVLLGTDAEGLELRCLAHYMNDPEFTREVLDGDIHTFNQNKAGLDTRDQAKTFIYALIYGAGPAKIGQIVGGGSREGKTMIDTFMTSLPKLQTLKSKVERAVQRGFITGLDGRRIPVQFPHTGLNYLLQGAGAIICKTWLVQIDRVIKQKRIRAVPVANIHDEIQFEVNRKDTDELTEATYASIRKTKTILGFNCDLNCSVVIGESWAETH